MCVPRAVLANRLFVLVTPDWGQRLLADGDSLQVASP